MKRKGLIAVTALAMVLGVGVAVGAHQEAEPVSAGTATTVYYAVPSATVGSYTVKCNVNRQGDADNWMQYDMTNTGRTYSGDPVYSASFTDVYDGLGKLQFQLYDGETWKSQVEAISSWTSVSNYNGKMWVHGGSSWMAYTPDPEVTKYSVDVYIDGVKVRTDQIAEGSLPVEPEEVFGKEFSGWFTDNTYTTPRTSVTSNCEVWGTMDAVASVTVTVMDPNNEMSNLHYYAFSGASEKEKAAWPGEAIDGVSNSFSIPKNATFIINNNNNGKQTANIHAPTSADTLIITSDTYSEGDDEGKYIHVWYSQLDKPADNKVGYFVVGVVGGVEDWSFASGLEMDPISPVDEEGRVAKLLNQHFAAGDSIKVRSYFEDRPDPKYPFDRWSNCCNGAVDYGSIVGGNFEFSKAGDYDVYAKYENDEFKFYVIEHEEPVVPDVPEGGYGCYICGDYTDYKFAGAQAMTVISSQEEVDTKGYNAYKLSFHLAAGEAIKPRCYYSDRLDKNDQWAIYDGTPDSTYGELDLDGNFKAKVAGDYDIYTKFEDRIGDSKEEYYFHVVNHKFSDTVSVTIGENTVNMTKVDKDTNKEQFEATISVASGDAISFKVGSAAMSPAPNGDDSLNNNVDKSCNKIIETKANAKVFLKVDYSGNVTFWVEGRNFDFYLVTDEYLGMGDNPTNPDEVMRTSVTLEAGDTLDFYCLTRFAPSGDDFHLDDKIPGAFTSDGSKVTCVKSGTYNFYLDDSAGDHSVLWIVGQTDADVKATAFANFFMGKFENGHGHTGVCHADGSTSKSVISTTWGECITEYNSKIKGDTDAEGILRNALASGDELYNLFADLYDTIYVKYGKDLVNFAGRSVTPTGGAIDGFVANDSFPAITIVAISLAITAYLSFTALIIIKRKRSHK